MTHNFHEYIWQNRRIYFAFSEKISYIKWSNKGISVQMTNDDHLMRLCRIIISQQFINPGWNNHLMIYTISENESTTFETYFWSASDKMNWPKNYAVYDNSCNEKEGFETSTIGLACWLVELYFAKQNRLSNWLIVSLITNNPRYQSFRLRLLTQDIRQRFHNTSTGHHVRSFGEEYSSPASKFQPTTNDYNRSLNILRAPTTPTQNQGKRTVNNN